jgi:hypothetical protein
MDFLHWRDEIHAGKGGRMNAKHTPGPWKLGKRAGNPAVYGQHGAEIAEVLHVLNDDWRENAALISAAPDLLAACKVMLKFVMKHNGEQARLGDCLVDEAFMLQDAISKAERGEG